MDTDRLRETLYKQVLQNSTLFWEAQMHGKSVKSVADLEIFRRGFSFTKMPEVKTKRKKKRSSPAF